MKLSFSKIQALEYLLFCCNSIINSTDPIKYKIITEYKGKFISANYIEISDNNFAFSKLNSSLKIDTKVIFGDDEYYIPELRAQFFENYLENKTELKDLFNNPALLFKFLVDFINSFDDSDSKHPQLDTAYNIVFLDSNISLPFLIMDENEYEVISLIKDN